jgi:hypothetical protein
MRECESIFDVVETRLRVILPLISHGTGSHVVRPKVIVCLFKLGIRIHTTVMQLQDYCACAADIAKFYTNLRFHPRVKSHSSWREMRRNKVSAHGEGEGIVRIVWYKEE